MKKKLVSILLTLAILCSFILPVYAADPYAMGDIEWHWAYNSICWVMESNLFYGTSDVTFSPDEPMTRGMFVTVLGRMAGIDPNNYKDWYMGSLYSDVSAELYYAPYINWATRYGIAAGMGNNEFCPNTPVTREQMATFIARYASIYNYALSSVLESTEYFSDQDSISSYAASAVETMRVTGLMVGVPDGWGGYYFEPQRSATRAECAALFARLSNSIYPYENRTLIDPTEIHILPGSVSLYIGESTNLISQISPADASNLTVTWISDNPAVISVDRGGKITAHSEGSAQIFAYTCNGCCAACTVTSAPNVSLAYDGESYNEKCIRIFGQVVSDPRYYYQSAAEAQSHMVTVSVQVWDFADSSRTTKITKTKYITVHENIAETVKAIFREIYNGPEQFPIYAVGGYRYEPGSEHMPGLAIDINPNENCQCRIDGTPIVGSYWRPGVDPYSIPLDGDVANAFKKYGFTQGAYWRSTRDYMHFSFFAT